MQQTVGTTGISRVELVGQDWQGNLKEYNDIGLERGKQSRE